MNILTKITSVAGFLPKKVLTNFDMEKITETNHEWIFQRTGINKRHICENQTSDMVFEVVKQCISPINQMKADGLFLKNHPHDENFSYHEYANNVNANKIVDAVPAQYNQITQIDCLIVATTTPDLTFPSTACIAQGKLKQIGIEIGFAFDIQAVCAGFVYALVVGDSFIKNGLCKNVLVVGADKLSSILNWNDRTTCVLFGDGAGAVLLNAKNDGESNLSNPSLYSDGSLVDLLKTSSGTGSNATSGHIIMEGKEVFRHAVSKMSDSVSTIIQKSGLSKDKINFVIAHQANERILDGVAKKLEMHQTNFIKTVGLHANTSSASIPLALNHCLNNGLIARGNNIIFEALGGGLAWGGLLCKW